MRKYHLHHFNRGICFSLSCHFCRFLLSCRLNLPADRICRYMPVICHFGSVCYKICFSLALQLVSLSRCIQHKLLALWSSSPSFLVLYHNAIESYLCYYVNLISYYSMCKKKDWEKRESIRQYGKRCRQRKRGNEKKRSLILTGEPKEESFQREHPSHEGHT